MISFHNVTKKFGTHTVLDRISFDIENNEFVVLTGASGVGKSTVIALLIGAEKPSEGSVEVDGMNVIEVYEASCEALERIRAGYGPQFLEMITYRYEGHSMGDPLRYRTKDEVEKWREDDPIGVLEHHLVQQELANRAELDAIDAEVDEEIEEAARFAEESPLPAPEALFEDIYVEA